MKELLAIKIEGEGFVKKVTRFYHGHHPELGKLTEGWSGKETIQTYDAVVPTGSYYVHERDNQNTRGNGSNLGFSGRERQMGLKDGGDKR